MKSRGLQLILSLSLVGVFTLLPLNRADAQVWQSQLNSLIDAESEEARDSLISEIVAAQPDWRDVLLEIQSIDFPDTATGRALLGETTCIDGVMRPYVVYVPSTYERTAPTPILLYLHGLAGRPEIMSEPHVKVAADTLVTFAEQRGWLLLFPMAQYGATWWDEVGMSNVMTTLRSVKEHFNVDDDRVYMGGFSDGGSGSFLFAMVMPTDFAAYAALNGYMGVGSEDGNLPTYANNMANTHIYVTTTDRDRLYPTSAIAPSIEMAEAAGAKIHYRKLPGEHREADIYCEYPAIFDHLAAHPRNSTPDKLTWETATPGFGACNWLVIDEIKDEPAGDWHIDHNTVLIDSTVSIGFIDDSSYKGNGVKVSSLSSGDCLAQNIKLEPGDIITGGNGITIDSLNDLSQFKATLRRGADVTLTILRNGNEMALSGQMPKPRHHLVFNHEWTSARMDASYSNNHFEIRESRVGSCRIKINPRMVDLDSNVIVTMNGKTLFDDRIECDLEYLLRDFLRNRDRKLMFVNEIVIHSPSM